jgi:hypothetical protein
VSFGKKNFGFWEEYFLLRILINNDTALSNFILLRKNIKNDNLFYFYVLAYVVERMGSGLLFHKFFQIPYWDEIGKLPGGEWMQLGIDFLLATDEGGVSGSSIILLLLSFIPFSRSGKSSSLFSKIQRISPNLNTYWLKNSPETLLMIFDILTNPRKTAFYIPKLLPLENLSKIFFNPLSKRLNETPRGRLISKSINEIYSHYTKYMELQSISAILNPENWKAAGNTIYHISNSINNIFRKDIPKVRASIVDKIINYLNKGNQAANALKKAKTYNVNKGNQAANILKKAKTYNVNNSNKETNATAKKIASRIGATVKKK